MIKLNKVLRPAPECSGAAASRAQAVEERRADEVKAGACASGGRSGAVQDDALRMAPVQPAVVAARARRGGLSVNELPVCIAVGERAIDGDGPVDGATEMRGVEVADAAACHERSHSCRQRTKPALGFMHARRERT